MVARYLKELMKATHPSSTLELHNFRFLQRYGQPSMTNGKWLFLAVSIAKPTKHFVLHKRNARK
jgi:hypothetical protein